MKRDRCMALAFVATLAAVCMLVLCFASPPVAEDPIYPQEVALTGDSSETVDQADVQTAVLIELKAAWPASPILCDRSPVRQPVAPALERLTEPAANDPPSSRPSLSRTDGMRHHATSVPAVDADWPVG